MSEIRILSWLSPPTKNWRRSMSPPTFDDEPARPWTECPPQRIPLLKDVLLLVMKQDRTRVSIQPKMDCVADAVALVKAMKAERWVGFNDGNLEYMAEVKRLAPDIPVFWDRGKDTNIDDDIAIAKKHGFEALVLHHEGVTPEKSPEDQSRRDRGRRMDGERPGHHEATAGCWCRANLYGSPTTAAFVEVEMN